MSVAEGDAGNFHVRGGLFLFNNDLHHSQVLRWMENHEEIYGKSMENLWKLLEIHGKSREILGKPWENLTSSPLFTKAMYSPNHGDMTRASREIIAGLVEGII